MIKKSIHNPKIFFSSKRLYPQVTPKARNRSEHTNTGETTSHQEQGTITQKKELLFVENNNQEEKELLSGETPETPFLKKTQKYTYSLFIPSLFLSLVVLLKIGFRKVDPFTKSPATKSLVNKKYQPAYKYNGVNQIKLSLLPTKNNTIIFNS